MALTLRLKQEFSIPIEVDTLRIDEVRSMSIAQVTAIPVQQGNRQLPVGDFFDVTGSAADDDTVVWEGDCRRVKLIGHAMNSGTMIVEGNAGMHTGAEMRGGEVLIRGDAGDWTGAEMKGGLIRVEGNSGHLVGAAYRGGRRGMTGGTILIDGNAGNEVGHTLRRGLIAIGGGTGDAVGVNLIAGSVFVFGEAGIRPGASMRRGTIAFFGDTPDLLPTFRRAGMLSAPPIWLRTYFKELRRLGFASAEQNCPPLERFLGDFLETGQGEILRRAA